MPVLAALAALILLSRSAGGQAPNRDATPDPGYASRVAAYEALRAKDYHRAIASFRDAIQAGSPTPSQQAAVRKDLAYTLLKIGETEEARDQFAEAMRLDPADRHVALEYAFLAFETKQQRQARLVFDRLRSDPGATAEQRRTAGEAFDNIDRPLREGIARWIEAVQHEPANFSAHEELARLAEQRNESTLAAEHFERAWRLRPDQRALLVELGTVWQRMGRHAEAHAALLAASRGPQPRAAESARELLPRRYPYVSEFEAALTLDPGNSELRRELAYLHLEMNNSAAAEREFELVLQHDPDDRLSAAQLGFLRLKRRDEAAAMPLLQRVLASGDDELSDRVRTALRLPQTLRRRPDTPRRSVSTQAKLLGERSLEKGYLNDALKYLQIAHENDPVDFGVMLKLGWTHNLLKQDQEALKWFQLARRSPDPAVAREADRAYQNLRPAFARTRVTAWAFPMFSSRWQTLFGYGQVKLDTRIRNWPLRPYVSLRFVGDTRGTVQSQPGSQLAFRPQFLSESSFIAALGVATRTWQGLTGWWESGQAIRYLNPEQGESRMLPDHRGGLSFARSVGHVLAPESKGWFAETTGDALFLSRFDNNFLIYSQNRMGYTLPRTGPLHLQAFWNAHITLDAKRQPWANFVEAGPGLRIRLPGMPQQIILSLEALRGAYRIREGLALPEVYHDLRIGVWYALTW
jgi:Tfp pilus assembly protein PilF